MRTNFGVRKKGKHLQSKNTMFKVILQKNGNLEILRKNRSIWSTDTITDNIGFMYLKKDGKLVLYGKNKTLLLFMCILRKNSRLQRYFGHMLFIGQIFLLFTFSTFLKRS